MFWVSGLSRRARLPAETTPLEWRRFDLGSCSPYKTSEQVDPCIALVAVSVKNRKKRKPVARAAGQSVLPPTSLEPLAPAPSSPMSSAVYVDDGPETLREIPARQRNGVLLAPR